MSASWILILCDEKLNFKLYITSTYCAIISKQIEQNINLFTSSSGFRI